tara:strand:- start:268 stop:1134 length:867 start_codon:yes stop_codon:yes gene_type:complete
MLSINSLSTSRILVIGGSGFLGSNIINIFQEFGVNNITCGDIVKNTDLNCSFIKIDLLNSSDLFKDLSGFDLIINCTGQITDPFNLCFKLNSEGIDNLLESIDSRVRIIHISTVAVYGSSEFCDENSSLNPETNYAVAKAFAEKKIIKSCNEKQFVILRLSNLYGFNQTKGISAYIIDSYKSDKKLVFNNNGDLIRSYIHVYDCVKIIYEIVKNDLFGIFNIKGDETLSIKELIKSFEKEFKTNFDIHYSNVNPWENILNLSNSKITKSINHANSWTLTNHFKSQIKN